MYLKSSSGRQSGWYPLQLHRLLLAAPALELYRWERQRAQVKQVAACYGLNYVTLKNVRASLVAQTVKNLPAMRETQV